MLSRSEKLMGKQIRLLLIFFLFSLTLHAQTYKYIGKKEGLDSRRVATICQGPKGFIWILNHKGVLRYDGKNFKHYPIFAGKVQINFYPEVNKLMIGPENKLWIAGTDGKIFLYNDLKDAFELKYDAVSFFQFSKNFRFSTYFQDSQGRFWLFTSNKVCMIDPSNDSFHTDSLPIHGEVKYITENTSDNSFYIATLTHVYHASWNRNQHFQTTLLPTIHFQSINYLFFHSRLQQLIISTQLEGLYTYTPITSRLNLITHVLDDISVNRILPYFRSPEKLLIATEGVGVLEVDIATNAAKPFSFEGDSGTNRLNGSIVKDLYIDSSKRIWLAIYPVGITVYSPLNPSYQWIKNKENIPFSASDNWITDVLVDSNNQLWATTTNGLNRFDTSSSKWEQIVETSLSNTNQVFLSLCEIQPGKILVGGYMSDLYLIDTNTGKTTYHFLQDQFGDKLLRRNIRAIYKDSPDNFWIGSYQRISHYNLADKTSESYISQYPITSIQKKSKTELWIGTLNGLYVFNKTKRKLYRYETGRHIGYINTIYTTPDLKTSYVGTYGWGLLAINNQTNKVKIYNQNNSGLHSNYIYSVLPNKYGDLFLGTENALTFFETSSGIFTNWDEEQGLYPVSFNPNATYKSPSGKLYFGTDMGVLVIPDSAIFKRKFSSLMILSDLHIHYKPVGPLDPNSPLKKPLNDISELRLSHDDNTLSLTVSSINFDNQSSVLYSWKLDGYYDDWTPPGTSGEIQFTNLPPGNYNLRIRSILRETNQILEERSISIIIDSPWWLSTWALIIYAIFLIFLFKLYSHVSELMRERKESQNKLSYFRHASQDVRTPLTLIKGPLEEVIKNEALSAKGLSYLQIALENTQALTEIADNILTFREEEVLGGNVFVMQTDIAEYLHQYIESYRAYANHIGITLDYKTEFTTKIVWIDRKKIYSILRNMMTNVLKYAKAGQAIHIFASSNPHEWTLSIQDKNRVVETPDQSASQSVHLGYTSTDQIATGAGLGMVLSNLLVKKHAGDIRFKSDTVHGTVFTITIPVQHKSYNYTTITVQDSQKNYFFNPESVKYTDIIQVDNSLNPKAPLLLLVEDSPSLTNFLISLLYPKFRIAHVKNGREGLEYCEKESPDLVVSETFLPELNGYQMCHKLKTQTSTSHIPIILLTGQNDNQSIMESIQAKADDYITKPFDISMLIAQIDKLLENQERLQQRFSTGQSFDNVDNSVASQDRQFLKQVNQLILDNLGKDFNVDTLCGYMNMSRTSFYNKMKALADKAPADYIRELRMKEAARLLRTRRFTISEVADKIGFADPKYFTDTFKKFYGMTPTAYMKQDEDPQKPL